MTSSSEAQRLENLWSSKFGDEYVSRNLESYEERGNFWDQIFNEISPKNVLEVGCNVGGNLQWISKKINPLNVYGIDINQSALSVVHSHLPEVNALWGPARELPFRDRWFDLVFSMGVLIHQPDSTLPLVMSEMVRCAQTWVLCGEYFSEEKIEVEYRGEDAALFKRNYGGIFIDLFPELELVRQGFLGQDSGWDDVTWWLFKKS